MAKEFKTGRGGIDVDDAEALHRLVRQRGIKTLLEFGPGQSTKLFLEAGVESIVTCEHNPEWREAAVKAFANDPRVTVLAYTNTPIVAIPELDILRRFDAVFVDSPDGTATRVIHPGQEGLSRYNTLEAALGFSDFVFMHDARRAGERASIARAGATRVVHWLATRKGIVTLEKPSVGVPI